MEITSVEPGFVLVEMKGPGIAGATMVGKALKLSEPDDPTALHPTLKVGDLLSFIYKDGSIQVAPRVVGPDDPPVPLWHCVIPRRSIMQIRLWDNKGW